MKKLPIEQLKKMHFDISYEIGWLFHNFEP